MLFVCSRVGYGEHMRVHVSLPAVVVAELDHRVGPRERSSFIEAAVRRALDDLRRDESFEEALGALAGADHAWDADPAGWVRQQRGDDRGTG